MLHGSTLVIIYTIMRKLAKTNKYQLLYSQYKETGTRIFQNEYNLTEFQVSFLQYLTFYSSIYTDIYMNEVSEVVLEDVTYEDAYVYYKQKSGKTKRLERSQSIKKPTTKSVNKKAPTSNTHVVFSRPK